MYSQEQIAALASYLGTISVVGIVGGILMIVGYWRIFTKAGQAGWKSIIPIYNGYVGYEIAWKPVMFWCSLVLGIVAGVCYVVGGSLLGVIGIIASLAAGIVYIVFNYKLAKAFGKGVGFAVGLLFLPFIFLLILGFGSAQYVGADQ